MNGCSRVAALVLFWATTAFAQQMESVQDLVSHLTPEQKQQFDAAGKAFQAQRFSEAWMTYKELLRQLPGDAAVSKLASEAALNAGDVAFALNTMKPIAAANPTDWQAAGLLTRACAESGDKAGRDAAMAHMLELHNQGVTPRWLQQYIVERVKVDENALLVRASLEPWGPYKVYDLGQVLDKTGRIFLRITLESSDSDQGLFAQQHPKEAAEGMRSFSLDDYRETGLNSNGQRTQTHDTYKMFVGQPSYETVRAEFVKIAAGKGEPMSSRTNLVVP